MQFPFMSNSITHDGKLENPHCQCTSISVMIIANILWSLTIQCIQHNGTCTGCGMRMYVCRYDICLAGRKTRVRRSSCATLSASARSALDSERSARLSLYFESHTHIPRIFIRTYSMFSSFCVSIPQTTALGSNLTVNTCDSHGYTPVHKAALLGRRRVMELLLAHGANTSCKANDHLTPLHLACQYNHKDVREKEGETKGWGISNLISFCCYLTGCAAAD